MRDIESAFIINHKEKLQTIEKYSSNDLDFFSLLLLLLLLLLLRNSDKHIFFVFYKYASYLQINVSKTDFTFYEKFNSNEKKYKKMESKLLNPI